MKNRRIAELFEQMADILDFQGANPFKINAYRKAGRVLRDLQQDIEILWQKHKLKSIPGISPALSKKIDEYLRTGRMVKYDEIVNSISPALTELMRIQNLGPRTLFQVHSQLDVQNLIDLERVISDGSHSRLPGVGPKKIEKLRKGLDLFKKGRGSLSG